MTNPTSSQRTRASKYLYAYANLKWTRRLKFVFFWVLAHALAGAIGLTLAEIVVRAPYLKSYSTAAGIIVFESVIAFGKHLVFLKFKELRIVRYTDFLAWFLAGLIVLIGELIEKNTYSETITLISLDILRFSAFLSLGIILSLLLAWVINKNRLGRIKTWPSQIEAFTNERLLFSLIKIPAYIAFGLLLFIAVCVTLSAVFFTMFILIIGPIEYFKLELEAMDWALGRVFLFGGYSVGYIGLLTGLFYTIRMQAFYVVKKPPNFDLNRK